MATNTKIVERVVTQLPEERPLVPGEKYKVLQSNGDLISYVVDSSGEPVMVRGITNDQWGRMERLTNNQVTKLEGLNSQQQIDQKINDVASKSTAEYYRIRQDQVLLPDNPTQGGVVLDNAWTWLINGNTYTINGEPYTVPTGKMIRADFDGSEEPGSKWTILDMGDIPGIDLGNYSLSNQNLLNVERSIGEVVPDYITNGVFTKAESSPTGIGFFTEGTSGGQSYFGWTFSILDQETVSAEMYIKGNPDEVRVTFYTDTEYISVHPLSIESEYDGVKHYSARGIIVPNGATRVRLVVFSSNASGDNIEFYKPYIGWGNELTSSDPLDSLKVPKVFSTLQLIQPTNVIPNDYVQMELPPNYRPPGQEEIVENNSELLGMPAYEVTSEDIDFTIGYMFNIFSDLDFESSDNLSSASIVVKVEGEMPTRVSLGRYPESGFIDYVNMVPRLISGDNVYLYSISNIGIAPNQARIAIQLLGKQGSVYTIAIPNITKGGEITDLNAKDVLGINSNESSPEPIVDENHISDVVSRVRLPFINGSLDIIDGQLVDRYTDLDYFTIWGSSTMHALGAYIQSGVMPLTGATQWFRGTQGGECVSHTSARMGARKLRSTFVSGVIPASGSAAITHNLKTHKLNYIKPFTGYFELQTGERVYGTASYSATSPTGMVFTRTTPGDVLTADQVYEFVPDFDEKFLCGYCVINVAKNDTDTPGATGMESEFLRTVEMYTRMKPAMPRCVVLGNFVNNNSSVDDPDRQKWVLDLNRRLEEHFGLLYIDVQGYLMGSQIWTDTGISPTSEDLEFQAKGELAPSLMQDFAHTNATVNAQIVDKLIKVKFQQLGWI